MIREDKQRRCAVLQCPPAITYLLAGANVEKPGTDPVVTPLSKGYMKRYFEKIDVRLEQGRPVRFRYHSGTHEITGIEEVWILQGNWWILEEKRTYHRVVTNKGVAVIFFRERKNLPDEWILEQLFD